MGTTPYLSWSFSRGKSYAQGCPRAFFFDYYAEGEKFGPLAKKLKRLTTPAMLVGKVVDWHVNDALRAFRRDGVMPTDIPNRGVRAFRRLLERSPQVCASMKLVGSVIPREAQPLHHDYYEYALSPSFTERCAERVADCLFNFESSELWETLSQMPVSGWRPAKANSEINAVDWKLDEIIVWSSVDFWCREQDILHILDWKSGRWSEAAQDQADQQLAVYAVFGHRHMGQDPTQIRTQVVFLSDPPHWEPRVVDPEDMRQAENMIRTQYSEELQRLERRGVDEHGRPVYYADVNDFPAQPEANRCFRCNHRRICREGLTLLKEHGERTPVDVGDDLHD